jgi:membrane fusion protein (multidrug efflux system)
MNTIPVVKHSSECGGGAAAIAKALAACLGHNPGSALVASILLIVSSLTLAGCASSHAAFKLPDTEVTVAAPVQQDVAVHSEWVASLDGYVNAEIRPQVSGYIVSQDYQEGAVVRKGQILFEIDPRPFQAALDGAKGQLASAKGQLAQAEALLGKSTIDVERDTPLVEQRAVPKEKLDNEIQAKLAAEAAVASAQAAIESAEAAVERAQLDLGWTKVTSLVDGVAGITEVQMGNLVGPIVRLTSVSQVDPIKVYFPVSEQEYLRAKHLSSSGQAMNLFDSSPELILADGTVYPHKGRVLMTDRQVDTNTGTIRLVAAFPNPGNILRPGQYGRVRIQTSMKKNALLVPQSAVQELQGGYQVALVSAERSSPCLFTPVSANIVTRAEPGEKVERMGFLPSPCPKRVDRAGAEAADQRGAPDPKVSIRSIKVGEKVGTMWVIDDGLTPGDQVIVEGVDKVKDGTSVVPKPAKIQGEGN